MEVREMLLILMIFTFFAHSSLLYSHCEGAFYCDLYNINSMVLAAFCPRDTFSGVALSGDISVEIPYPAPTR
jgi:hypothetical protein